MLCDNDRTLKYKEAVTLLVERFRREQGHAPAVLDFGSGSGLLGLFALQAGASSVTLLDKNRDMNSIARQALTAEGFTEGMDFFVAESLGDLGQGPAMFDAMVSEIVGTLTTSESCMHYWRDAHPFLRTFEGQWYCVPNRLEQRAQIMTFADFASLPSGQSNFAYTFDAVFGQACTGRDIALFSTTETGLPWHELQSSCLSEPYTVRTDFLGGRGLDRTSFLETRWNPEPMRISGIHADSKTFLVLEWTVTLAEPRDGAAVTLTNSFEEYRRLGSANGSSRNASWGIMLAYLTQPTKSKLIPTTVLKFSDGKSGMLKVMASRAKNSSEKESGTSSKKRSAA